MGLFVKGAGIVGSLLVIIALVIALLKALIGFVGFLAFAVKVVIFLIFVTVFAGVGFMIFRAWQDKQKSV